MKRYKTADEYFDAQDKWRPGLNVLRRLLLQTELEETVKWGFPVYTVNGMNVAGLGSFKSYFGIWFFQGVFMKDAAGKLINAQEGRTKGMRQWRMTSADEIDDALVLSYLEEAIENSKAGKEIKPEKKPLVIPPELLKEFDTDSGVQEAFDSFSLFKRREFAEYIADAKRAETKIKRLEKIIPMIQNGVGLNDKYR